MYGFHSSGPFPGLPVRRGVIIRPALFIIFFFSLVSVFNRCVTVDKNNKPIRQTEPVTDGKLRLENFPVHPAWSEEEILIPLIIAGLPDNPPDNFTISNLPPVGNQGPHPSGTAWAAGHVAMTRLIMSRKKADYVCSPSFIYNQLKKNNRGIEIIEALHLLKESGCPDISYMPYDPQNIHSKPNEAALKNAAANKIDGFGRVDFTDVDQVRAHLLQGSVVIATLRITGDFLTLNKGHWENPEGVLVGRHTLAIIGYEHKKRVFILRNSAGIHWGEFGITRIPYAWFVRLTGQAYVIW